MHNAPDLDELFSSAVEIQDHEQGETNGVRTTGSTDSSFFRKVYDEHNAAEFLQDQNLDLACAIGPPKDSNTTNVTSPGTRDRQGLDQEDEQFGTSITDPVPGSRRTRIKSVVDLTFTQVTTPREGMGNARDDPWEIPSSPPASKVAGGAAATGSSDSQLRSTSMKSQGERKRSRYSSPPPNTSLPTAVRITDGLASRILDEDSSELVGIDDEISTSSRWKGSRNTPISAQRPQSSSFEIEGQGQNGVALAFASTGESAIKSAAPASIYVTPGALTASQRQEYQLVSVSSDPPQQEDYAYLPAPQQDSLHKSSCATTIAYPTPSEFASSSAKMDPAPQPRSARKSVLASQPGELVCANFPNLVGLY